MQDPQYPSSGNQFTASGLTKGYSIFQSVENIDARVESRPQNSSVFQNPDEVAKQLQGAIQNDLAQTQSHKLSDRSLSDHNLSNQPETTWRWGSQNKVSGQTLSTNDSPLVQHVPANEQSFAPPENLDQLQHFASSQIHDNYAGDVYKSPIDRLSVRHSQDQLEQFNAHDGSNTDGNNIDRKEESLSSAQSLDAVAENSATQSAKTLTQPQRDQITEAKEFVSRGLTDRPLFIAPSLPSTSASGGKSLIVLRSQSPQKLAEARAKEATARLPDAQLLTPNFESYVGSPVLDTAQNAYQDETQWRVYTPKPIVDELPPPAVFVSLSEVSTPSPAVKFSQPTPPKPAPAKVVFEPVEEVAALPEPSPTATPKRESGLFAPTLEANSFQKKILDTSHWSEMPVKRETPVNQVSVAKGASSNGNSTISSYRFERRETEFDKKSSFDKSGYDVHAHTTAMTVAHSTPETAPVTPDSAWLSPWWMLVCLVPLAMYLVGRRTNRDECSYAYGEVGEQVRLPEEMIERPGYSKSDAIYGESDEFFVSERLYAQPRRRPIADKIPMANHQASSMPAPANTESASAMRFASTNKVPTETELSSDISPNFRVPQGDSSSNARGSHGAEPLKIKTSARRKKKRS